MKTIAAMIAERSPGARAPGELASLKHKRVPALHERALPKIRRAPPPSPLATIVAPPEVPPAVVPPVATPLYNAVTTSTAVGEAPPTFFPAMAPPPGGGFVVPPIVTQVTPPTPPEVPPPAVPEPASWAMMLIGFAFVGWNARRGGRAAQLLS